MAVNHLGIDAGQIEGATLALLPGDPARVGLIAATLDSPRAIASEREFTTWRASAAGRPVVVTSTGIGGPSLSIAVEELAELGVRTFVRVGTTGAIQPGIAPGDVVISTGAVRLDGASRHFAPLEYPAVADFGVVGALIEGAVANEVRMHLGITASSDTFYPGQERRDTFRGYVLPELQGSIQMWSTLGVLNFEMEAATLFVMAATMGLRAGAVSGVILNRAETESLADGAVAMAEQNAVLVATSAAAVLLDL
ncbi:MAG TPA: uridine phosphorylase [Actinomycetota bacterium]|nr:uridine phosphorylase [Actinomycetota bacterium]